MDAGATRGKVPIAAAVVAAWRSVFARPGLVLEFGWLPLLAMLAALLLPGLALRYVVPADLANSWSSSVDLADVILDEIVTLLALSAFALRWHRLMLTGDLHPWPRRVFIRAWLRFVLYALAMIYPLRIDIFAVLWFGGSLVPVGTGAVVAGYGPAAWPVAAAAVAVPVLLISLARLSLLFPAAAFGEPLGIGAVWRAMRGNTWRLLLAIVLAILPIILITGLLLDQVLAAVNLGPGEVLAKNPPVGLLLLTAVIEVVLRLVLAALAASVLSGFYRRIILQRRESER